MGKEAEQEFYTVRGYQLLEQHRAHLTPSLEDYLEMICRRIQEDGSVKAVALAEWLNVQPPSVSRMLRRLAQLQLVEHGFSRETVGYLSKLTWFLKEHEEEYAAFLKMFPENK